MHLIMENGRLGEEPKKAAIVDTYNGTVETSNKLLLPPCSDL